MRTAAWAVVLAWAGAGVAWGGLKVGAVSEVDRVWAGHPVGFALLTHGRKQYVGYYDADRNLVVAERELGAKEWVKTVLPTKVGWDSHNYVAMAVDDDGQLHVAANMHAVPLVYFRTTKAGDATSLVRVKEMVGRDELKCTYPVFFRGPKGELMFNYRSGVSGNGDQIYDVYRGGGKWERLLDRPLTDGEGLRNAYFEGPTKGPDGWFHLAWVWRETPACETNHDLSYARSRDLVHWENAAGTALPLPMKLGDDDVVDPVPVNGGIINGQTHVGWDSKGRVIVSYFKFDENGKTQAYSARFEDGKWKIHQTSDWDYRWSFSGGGSIVFEVRVGPVKVEKDGRLTQAYSHVKYGSGEWVLDEATLKPVGKMKREADRPAELGKVESPFPGMGVKWAGDSGGAGEAGVKYWLRWETLGQNRDRPREGEVPQASALRVYKVVEDRGVK